MNSGAPHQGLTPPSQPRSDDEATLAGSKGGSQPEKMEAAQKQAPAPAESSEQSTPEPTVVEKPPVDGPPPLPYNLREHKLTISIFWFLILTECTLIPLIFYYTIANLTDMRRGAMFAIITAMFGFISGGEYGLRGLRLCLKRDEYRPLNSPGRWGFDSTHLVLGPPYFVMTALMIGFSIPEPPIVPPLTFCIMEDICGCDGGGGKVYRTAAMARYNASPRFRRMLVQMLWWWAITAILLGAAQIAIIWIPQISQEVVYGIGWSVTSVWGGIGAWLTIWWGKKCIRIEKEKWAEDQAAQLQRG